MAEIGIVGFGQFGQFGQFTARHLVPFFDVAVCDSIDLKPKSEDSRELFEQLKRAIRLPKTSAKFLSKN